MNKVPKPLSDIMQSQNDTLLRLLTMLRHIPKHPYQITAKELTERLKGAFFKVSKRTVERDLLSLSEVFSLISNERSRPYGWSWSVDASPQFDEVTNIVVNSRNFESGLSEVDAKVFGAGTFCYSDQLIEETRQALSDMPVGRDDYLYFKDWDGRFGKMSIFDLMSKKLLLKVNDTGAEILFESDNELIAAGWVID